MSTMLADISKIARRCFRCVIDEYSFLPGLFSQIDLICRWHFMHSMNDTFIIIIVIITSIKYTFFNSAPLTSGWILTSFTSTKFKQSYLAYFYSELNAVFRYLILVPSPFNLTISFKCRSFLFFQVTFNSTNLDTYSLEA